MQDERRVGYVDIANKLEDVSKQLAITNANLNNVVDLFKAHLEDDKRTVVRVNELSDKVSSTRGTMVVITAIAIAVVGSMFRGIKL